MSSRKRLGMICVHANIDTVLRTTLERLLRETDQHQYCLEDNLGKTAKRLRTVYLGLSECCDAISRRKWKLMLKTEVCAGEKKEISFFSLL